MPQTESLTIRGDHLKWDASLAGKWLLDVLEVMCRAMEELVIGPTPSKRPNYNLYYHHDEHHRMGLVVGPAVCGNLNGLSDTNSFINSYYEANECGGGGRGGASSRVRVTANPSTTGNTVNNNNAATTLLSLLNTVLPSGGSAGSTSIDVNALTALLTAAQGDGRAANAEATNTAATQARSGTPLPIGLGNVVLQ